ncbi:VOC family protein [Kitasatospora sp. NPDC008050]|uniref:VOC family protein n=1 Tax=Kitasatospora sp. NPDC008050 TaxID=3364021 RepID=UPI0036E017BF
MALHRLSSVTMGVPDPAATTAYYTDFGLTPAEAGWFATGDGGRQLRIVPAPTRRLVELCVGVDNADDLEAARARLAQLGVPTHRAGVELSVVEPVTAVRAVLRTEARSGQPATPPTPYNGPGRIERPGVRAPGILRSGPVRPRRLGHVVLGTTDLAATAAFFRDGLGFLVSDVLGQAGVFLRCSTDHHNLLLLHAPVAFLHHTSWQVEDVDEIGRGAMAMLEDHPERHVWGLGRHLIGSNFFWYLKDPAGNFSEYYADLDCIPEDQLWTPEVFEGARSLFSWGPPPPPSFLAPEDLADLMAGSHT